MYLTIKQHDMFRTLLMGFEIPFRSYIADVVTSNYRTDFSFETAMLAKHRMLSPASPQFLRDVLQNAVSKNNLKKTYKKFVTAKTSVDEIVTTDIDLPMVGALNLVTFALTETFGDLHLLFGSYSSYCDLAEKYRYLRKARSIERMLSQNWYSLGKAHKHAVQLRTRLKDFGPY